jgi:predicted AlkP superfamily pyrophosphatase or phosphodiesterase
MQRTVVLLVVGLTGELLGEATPNLLALAARGGQRPLGTVLPAVTCSVQASFVTGTLPSDHGCVGNGWYFRDQSEVRLWQQSNALVHGDKIWDVARRRDERFTCAKLFWWYNMYSSADFSVTPRPIYRADGKKIPDIYSHPGALRDELVAHLGAFPLFHFWGPTADIVSSRWIARAAIRVFDRYAPSLTLVYLPHLDYDLQRLGPGAPGIGRALREIDDVCGELIEHCERAGARLVVLSEYGIVAVKGPVHINRALRAAGLLRVRDELGHEQLDAGASDAFAVADHQIAHVYVRRPELQDEVARLVVGLEGVDQVLDLDGKRAAGLDHPRAGELVAVARRDSWFSYYFWLDDDHAPDYARTVDIHRKPGYDPAELFVDPRLRAPKLRLAARLAQKALGFRYLMDVIPLEAGLVRGSHGRLPDSPAEGPVILSSAPHLLPEAPGALDVKDILLRHVFDA